MRVSLLVAVKAQKGTDEFFLHAEDELRPVSFRGGGLCGLSRRGVRPWLVELRRVVDRPTPEYSRAEGHATKVCGRCGGSSIYAEPLALIVTPFRRVEKCAPCRRKIRLIID